MLNQIRGTWLTKICQIFLLFNLLLILTSCNNAGGTSTPPPNITSPNPNAKITTHNLDNFYLMGMGSGYDSSTNTATSGQSCLAAASSESNIIIGNPSALMTFGQQQDFSTLQNALGVDISGQFGGAMFSASLAAQYAVNSQDTQYTTNIIYLYQYAGVATFAQGALNQGNAALTPVAASLVNSNPVGFREMCGDNFVAQMQAGILLGVTLTLSFDSHMDQEAFDASFDFNAGLASISAAIEAAAAQTNVHVDFSLSAIQMGGEPQQLNNLFGQVGSDGNYPFVDCGSVGSTNASACNAMISAIIAYSQTIESEVSNPDGSLNLNNLYYSNPVVANYNTLGITVGAPNPSQTVLDAMQTLTAQYNKAVYDYNFVNHYLTALSGYLDAPTEENLEDAQQKLNNQINNVYLSPTYQLLNCYSGYVTESCVTIEQNVDNALAYYQLLPQESEEINYLETNSYSAQLYQYNGESVENASNYQIGNQECIFAPISSPTEADYAMNCGDSSTWQTGLAGVPLTIESGPANSVQVNGLAYDSGTPYTEPISYENATLAVDPFYNNYYTEIGLTVTGGSTFTTTAATLGLTRWFENQA